MKNWPAQSAGGAKIIPAGVRFTGFPAASSEDSSDRVRRMTFLTCSVLAFPSIGDSFQNRRTNIITIIITLHIELNEVPALFMLQLPYSGRVWTQVECNRKMTEKYIYKIKYNKKRKKIDGGVRNYYDYELLVKFAG